MNKKIKIFTVLIILGLVSGLILFNEDEGINYAYIPTALIDAPSAISENNFEENSINGKPFSTGIETIQALIGDATDIATLAEWPFLLSSLKRDDLRIVAVISTAKSMGMVANKDQGINTVKDLVGKKVGFPQGTSAQFVYETLIDKAGIKNEVQAISLAPPNLQPSLIRGDIDAMVVWQPFLEKAIQENPEKYTFISGSEEALRVVYLVVTTEKYIKENPKGIRKVLEVLLEAEKRLDTKDSATLELLSKKTNLSKASLDKLLPLFEYDVKLDNTIIKTLERLSIWAESTGIADKKVLEQNWRNFIHADILEKLAPQNVKF
ncbi:MAG: ABC transporter substrate-binding protein [Flavobacteriaceae bacterium]